MSAVHYCYYSYFVASISMQTDLSFMPSVGLEFITQMGVHIPDYVEAGLEMHTNMYHESSLNAKVTMNRNQMRLSIPAPKSNTQLLSIRLVACVSNDKTLVQLSVIVLPHYFITLLSLFEIQQQAGVSLLWSNKNTAISGGGPD